VPYWWSDRVTELPVRLSVSLLDWSSERVSGTLAAFVSTIYSKNEFVKSGLQKARLYIMNILYMT